MQADGRREREKQRSHTVECLVPLTTNLIRAGLEDEDDRIEPAALNAPTTMRFSSEGDGGNDVLIGTSQNDVLDGVGGADNIFGRGGNDSLEGASGDDDMFGEAGDDTLSGGAQSDDVNGGIGADDMFGGTGNDNLNANDHAGGDTLDCGEHLFDNDLGVYNPGDTISSDCERKRLEL